MEDLEGEEPEEQVEDFEVFLAEHMTSWAFIWTPYKILSVAASMAKVLQLFVLPVSGSHRSAGRDQTFGRPAASSGSAWSELDI